MAKNSAVAPRSLPNSSAIGPKKAPKLYATPNTVNVDKKVAPVTNQPAALSTRAGSATVEVREGDVTLMSFEFRLPVMSGQMAGQT